MSHLARWPRSGFSRLARVRVELSSSDDEVDESQEALRRRVEARVEQRANKAGLYGREFEDLKLFSVCVVNAYSVCVSESFHQFEGYRTVRRACVVSWRLADCVRSLLSLHS